MAGVARSLAQLAGMLVRGAGMVLKGETMGQSMAAEGSAAPSFSVTAHDGHPLTLEEFKGKKHVVLFFFPRAETPG